jgi:putative membrane protein insertion efficiency factor
MGHRHTPEERHGARAVCGADGGSATTAAERRGEWEGVGSGEIATDFACACAAGTDGEDRLKSIPLGVRIALFALRFYKAYLSMLFAGSCRFEPTCSRYSYEAVERFGVVRGSWLTLKRLLRCQPLSRKFGFDPVPETWEDTPTSSAAAVGGRSIGANEVHS